MIMDFIISCSSARWKAVREEVLEEVEVLRLIGWKDSIRNLEGE